jgi:plasmid stabilization system protein ParE
MQVRWTAPAAQDLEDITLYIQRDSESAARDVAKVLFDAANSLDLLPSRGRVGRIPRTRELVVPGLPYIVLYEIADTAVQILHIYHGARNWPGER